jgi:fatty-acyl-CoA synthase
MISRSDREYNRRTRFFPRIANFFLSNEIPNAVSEATLTSLLRSDAAPALIDRGHPVSFRALAEESCRVAQGLRTLGVRAGDRVALWLPNVPAWLAAFFACTRLGAIAVAVNTRFRSAELADIVRRSGARVLFFWPGFKGIDFAGILAACDPPALARLEALVVYSEAGSEPRLELGGKTIVPYGTLAASDPLLSDESRPDAGCALFTTSGTTKAPKFVLHDQRTVIAHARDVVQGFAIGKDAALLLVPPLCGVFGFCSAMAALSAGRPTLMAPAWDPAQAARDIVAHRITHINGTDEAAAQLLDIPGASFAHVQLFGYASFNPDQAEIVARADARGLKLVGLYGASELQALLARQPEEAAPQDRMLGGGRLVSPLARVRTRDPESGQLLAHGAQGELEFLAPSSRMVEYFENAEATREAFTADDYYRSGDLGYTLEDGRFIYLARLGDALRLGGFLVSPAEIEAVVQEVAGIAACQVVGARAAAGLVPIAFVVLQEGAALDERAVLAHVAGKLARFKVPQRVFPIDAFPVTPGANATKIQKGKLREMAEALLH